MQHTYIDVYVYMDVYVHTCMRTCRKYICVSLAGMVTLMLKVVHTFVTHVATRAVHDGYTVTCMACDCANGGVLGAEVFPWLGSSLASVFSCKI